MVLWLVAAGFQLIKTQNPFELNEILKGDFRNKGWNGTWISGKDLVYTLDTDKNVYKLDVSTGTRSIFFSSTVLEAYPGGSFELSADAEFALIEYNTKSVRENPKF